MELPTMIILAAIPAFIALGGYGMRLVFLFKIYREGGLEHLLIVTRGWHASRRGGPDGIAPFPGMPSPPRASR
ncbi:hypothetical protein [Amycolatopsis sp. NPDC098790]|uniref:hypothetical protein n=1 Tax=Amycolatopsis sp. NPDC098790 TaxID=3363939 RepID=UPI0037F64F66